MRDVDLQELLTYEIWQEATSGRSSGRQGKKEVAKEVSKDAPEPEVRFRLR
jgi:hypothetical protein